MSAVESVEGTKPVNLRFLDIGPDAALRSVFLGRANMRRIVSQKLGLDLRDDESLLECWLRAMSEENGLPYTEPAHRAIGAAIEASPAVGRFVFAIAGN